VLDAISTRCPWCGERFEVLVDSSGGSAEYVEDCQVCCRPITFRLDTNGDGSIDGFAAGRDD
jgi:hypothetical protein